VNTVTDHLSKTDSCPHSTPTAAAVTSNCNHSSSRSSNGKSPLLDVSRGEGPVAGSGGGVHSLSQRTSINTSSSISSCSLTPRASPPTALNPRFLTSPAVVSAATTITPQLDHPKAVPDTPFGLAYPSHARAHTKKGPSPHVQSSVPNALAGSAERAPSDRGGRGGGPKTEKLTQEHKDKLRRATKRGLLEVGGYSFIIVIITTTYSTITTTAIVIIFLLLLLVRLHQAGLPRAHPQFETAFKTLY
jgi:hypothetical protein